MRCSLRSITANASSRRVTYPSRFCCLSFKPGGQIQGANLVTSALSSVRQVSPINNTQRFIYATHSRQTVEVQRVVQGEELAATPPPSARLSRAVVQTVRLFVAGEDFRNAYHVVNSVRFSAYGGNDRPPAKIPGVRWQFKPTQFHQPVSLRLVAHTLLHSLIRAGLTKKAYRQAQLMMQDGIRFRAASLDATIISLLPNTALFPETAPKHPSLRVRQTAEGPRVLRLHPGLVSDISTRQAVRLFLQSKHYRQQRSENVYQSLINACLLQGELLVGSLLFVMVVQDWRLKRKIAIQPGNHPAKNEDPVEGLVHPPPVRPPRILDAPRTLKPQWMHDLLSSIDAELSQEEPGFQTLQALANLAALLDRHDIPFPEVAPLIRVLYRCPRVDTLVWLKGRGIPYQVNAHSYFHEVLKRLMKSLPSGRPPEIAHPSQKAVSPPPLDLHAYNSLLHYALRHRYSPALADEVIQHMTVERRPSLEPDITTYNILLRSGTLLRKSDITEHVLARIRNVEDRVVEPPGKHHGYLKSRSSRRLRRIATQTMRMPSTNASEALKADSFTVSTYLTHLTATGKPHIVIRVLFRLFPELFSHPRWDSLSPENQRELMLDRAACVKRAVKCGPYFFTAVLSALSKAGKTSLAERLWLLAKEAERATWTKESMPKSGPWCLPIHAYTSMIQCYAGEARKSLVSRRQGQLYNDYHSSPENASGESPTGTGYVRGWAKSLHSRSGPRHRISRSSAGRQMGSIIIRSMKSSTRAICRALLDANSVDRLKWKNVQIPVPDARFFNAALDLFAQHPRMPLYASHTARLCWGRDPDPARSRHALHDTPRAISDQQLHYLLREVVETSNSVPPELRHLLVQRGLPSKQLMGSRGRLPFHLQLSMRGRSLFRACTIPVAKTRGLPIRRRPYGRRLRTAKAAKASTIA